MDAELEAQVRRVRAIEAIGRLAGGIAHDFNNLLAAIAGYTELLIGNFPPTDPCVQEAYEIRRAALGAARFTHQLLALGRGQEGHPEVLDPNAVVAHMTGLLKRTLGGDIDVVLELDPGVRSIKVDRGHLEQVILNLAVNARDAMPGGGRLTIGTANAGAFVRLVVSDTGCGMPGAIQRHIFEPFFTTKGEQGTGLGLAMVHGAVTRSGGSIDVHSIEQVGTTFTIDLPVSDEPMREPPSASPRRLVGGFATVLVAEDDPRVRSLAELVLRRAGHDVVTAAGADAAIAAIKAQTDIEVALLDIVMPDMTGFDVAAEIRRLAPWVRIVYMSGFTSDHFRQPVDEPFVAKPFTVETLTHAIQQALATGESGI